MRYPIRSLFFAALSVLPLISANADVKLTTEQINVINSTPLGGIGLPIEKVPSNVQVVKGSEMQNRGSLTIAEYMNSEMSGVSVNETQGNPFQPDVSYRGFSASPLLGAPQGLSVYQDGVRLNEPFGDVVSWDLIPMNAVKNMTLISGTNPVFGLNTMGGAISIETKRGRDVRGGAVEVSGGSWGRKNTQFEYGGVGSNGLDYFVSGNYFDENGWRDASPSTVKQMFGQLGWQNEKTDINLTMSLADNKLVGNGLIPVDMMNSLGRDSIYTKPDETANKMAFLNLKASHWLNKDTMLSGNMYHRNVRTNTFNGDLNDDAEEFRAASYPSDELAIAAAACRSGLNADLRSKGTAKTGWGVDKTCSGAINRSNTHKLGSGFSSQIAFNQSLMGLENQLITGLTYDYSKIKFNSSKQFGVVASDRSIEAVSSFDADSAVNLKGETNTWGLFATDTVSINKQLSATLSGRYNNVNIDNRDQLTHEDPASSLTGRHVFQRFNPAVGLAFTPQENVTLYGSYNEGARAPTSMELGCANPGKPCKMPNAMAGDPPLKQVVTRTVDGGIRGTFANNIAYSLSAYFSKNYDDLQFVGTQASAGLGYFTNIEQTQRKGLDLALSGKYEKLSWLASYSFVDATYGTDILLPSADNSSKAKRDCNGASTGDYYFICARNGDRIPGIARHQFKLRTSYDLSDNWNLGVNVIAFSGKYAQGNENNLYGPVSTSYYTNGQVAGYTVINLDTRYRFDNTGWQLFAKVNNLFDKDYATGGMVGGNMFGDPAIGKSASEYYGDDHRTTFVSPGAPRAAWVGLRWEFGGAKKSAE